MSTTRDTLSTMTEALRQRGGPWSCAQDLGADRARVTAAWRASEDPFAMLLLLAAIHPHPNEPVCLALVAGMSFFSPMRREGETQAQSLAGMNYNGPDRARFLHLAQRIRGALSETPAAERSTVAQELSAAIRVVVGDPYALTGT